MRFSVSANIVERIRRRDEAAFNELLAVAGPPLIGFAMSYGHSYDDAEDLLQGVLVGVWRMGERFAPTVSIEAYLFSAVRNAAVRAIRTAGTQERYARRYAADAAIEQSVSMPAFPGESDRADELARLRQSLDALTEHQRTAFTLRYGQEMTIAEIAHVLGITPKGVERLMTRINKLIRDQIVGDGS